MIPIISGMLGGMLVALISMSPIQAVQTATPSSAGSVPSATEHSVFLNFPERLPGTEDGWIVYVNRSGGLTGAVKDDFRLNSLHPPDSVSHDEFLSRLTSAILQARLAVSNTVPNHNLIQSVCSDCMTTRVGFWSRISGQEIFYSVNWDMTTRASIPQEILALYDAAMTVRPSASDPEAPIH